ncbi:HNH endonuclease [Sphingomonas sp. FUKUSWIS1]
MDRIELKALGGTDTWDNTQSLCHHCHVAKTTTDTRRMRRG